MKYLVAIVYAGFEIIFFVYVTYMDFAWSLLWGFIALLVIYSSLRPHTKLLILAPVCAAFCYFPTILFDLAGRWNARARFHEYSDGWLWNDLSQPAGVVVARLLLFLVISSIVWLISRAVSRTKARGMPTAP